MARASEASKRGYLLPLEIAPLDHISVCVPVPNDINHIRAFLGQLDALGYWYTWDKDTLKQGTLAAAVWREIVETVRERVVNGEDCENMGYFRMRVSPENSRVSQAQYEIDGDWIDFLDNTCCDVTDAQPTQSRFNDDGDLEISNDGGETWIPDPTDPRDTLAILPLPTGGDVKCKVSGSIVATIVNQQDVLSSDAELWGGISGLLSALVALLIEIGIIGSGGVLTPFLLGIAGALLVAGKSAFDAAMTEDVYNRLQEIIYCALESDGNLTSGGWDEVIRKAGGEFAGIAGVFIVKVLQLWQVNGTNQAGRVGLTRDNDCTGFSCPCVDHFYAYVGEEVEPYYTGMRSFKSVPQDGVNRVEVRTNEETNCCNILLNYFDLEGETGDHFTPFGAAIWKCGDPWNEPNPGQGFLGNCRNRARFQTHPVLNPDTVFVVSFLTEDCTP